MLALQNASRIVCFAVLKTLEGQWGVPFLGGVYYIEQEYRTRKKKKAGIGGLCRRSYCDVLQPDC